jgi:AcrR family transcriptional regulator
MSPRGKQLNEQMRAEAIAKITRAALEVFAGFGYHGTKMEQIMQVSGLSKGLVYHYFPSKESLFFHLVDSALEISRNIWQDALETPGTAWEKIERLSASLVETTFTEQYSLYFLIMVQAMTQAKGIPGLMEFILPRTAHFAELPRLIVEAQASGDAAQGDPGMLATTYFALFQGFTFILHDNDELKGKISPEMFTNLLRNPAQTT